MSFSVQKSQFFNTIPKSVLVVLIATFSIGLFIVGFDQGHIFSLMFGESAFIDQFVHEFTHDMRHAAGFPCH
jgi:cobalt transporter subunit CbtB